MKTLTTTNNKLLKDFLLLNAFSCVSTGLTKGKAGFALVLFEMATALKDDKIEEQAFDLLQQALVLLSFCC